MTEPLYVHDCGSCIYLGRFVGNEPYQSNDHELDLYVCTGIGMSTVVARYSSEGPDYHSGLVFVEHVPALTEAYHRAVAGGLLRKG